MSDESNQEPTEMGETGQPAEGLVAPTGSEEGPRTIPTDTETGPDDRRPEVDAPGREEGTDEVILDKTDDE